MKRTRVILLIIAVILIIMTGFFVFATTISSPTQLTLNMPKDGKDEETKFANVRSKLTLILLNNDKVFGYYGDFINGGKITSTDETNSFIQNGWKMFSKDSLVVVIKPSEKATYKETVAMLDRMSANQIERYSMTDLNKKEKEFLKINE